MSEARVKTVLVVDNDRAVRDTMVKVVEMMGYRAVAVERATRAVPVLRGGQVDAVLLDLHMPGPHGDHLLSYLKRNGIPIPPTIVVSGYLDQERIGPLLEFGVSGIVAKPFEVRRLMDELRCALEGEDRGRVQYCPQCGTTAGREDRFCRHCGCRLDSSAECPVCHQPCQPGDRYCGGCGARIGSSRNGGNGR
ncbi:MAG: response regulator [Candidatus Latescibacterota bacterium]